jgi:hypothetical protein
VTGAADEKYVYVWDAEHGDELLSLDHGGQFPNIRWIILTVSQMVQKYTQ